MLFRTRPNRPELEATKIPTAIDIAWAAGIFEGEGNVRLCGRTKRGLMAAVAQKDPELLYRLKCWFGGSISDNGSGSGCHTWNICGDRARIFIALIYGFLTARRKIQVENARALEFLHGESPVDLSTQELQSRMLTFYEAHRATTWRGSNKSEIRKKKYQENKAKVTAIA